MRRRSNFSLEAKHLLAICSIVCILFIIVSFKYKEKIQPVKTAVGTVISPMQRGINSVGTWISDKMEIVTTMKKLIKDNKQLQEDLDIALYESKILQQEKYELESLRKLYELDNKYPSYPKVAARIINKDSNNWYNQFCIDKGSDDGFAVDMNVMAGKGLVGIITEVGPNYSKVRSIIDDTSNVSGMFLKTSDKCNVKGNLRLIDKGTIEVEMINKDSKIEDGYEVVTSYISDKFLQGILIGYISNISMDSSNVTKSGYLTPAVDFKSLDTVLVITELKEELPKKATQY
jgi:rod shape-determining protein MreC